MTHTLRELQGIYKPRAAGFFFFCFFLRIASAARVPISNESLPVVPSNKIAYSPVTKILKEMVSLVPQ